MKRGDNDGYKVFTGYGADEADLRRGFIAPAIRELPEYDKANYVDRYSSPKVPDEDFGNSGILGADYEFRSKDRVSKGFLTRPRIPSER